MLNKKDNIHSNYDSWLQTHWRPMLAVTYMIIIIFDFIIGPIFWTLVQAIFEGQIAQPWVPLTLGSGGLFHVGMSAILGISAFTRGVEKQKQIESFNKQNNIHDGNQQ
jgi:hypothetical protein